MQADKTIAEHTVPEEQKTYTIEKFTLRPGSFNVDVRAGEDVAVPDSHTADMTIEWGNMSQDNKDFLNTVFKKIAAEALGVTVNDITGDLWT